MLNDIHFQNSYAFWVMFAEIVVLTCKIGIRPKFRSRRFLISEKYVVVLIVLWVLHVLIQIYRFGVLRILLALLVVTGTTINRWLPVCRPLKSWNRNMPNVLPIQRLRNLRNWRILNVKSQASHDSKTCDCTFFNFTPKEAFEMMTSKNRTHFLWDLRKDAGIWKHHWEPRNNVTCELETESISWTAYRGFLSQRLSIKRLAETSSEKMVLEVWL